MRKLTLIAALLLTTAAAAHAQSPNGSPGFDPQREALRERNTTRLDEAHISVSRASSAKLEREAAASRRGTTKTFKAVVEVTNSAAKAIKSVSWTATLTEVGTGNVIRSYDVETKTRIKPGTTKKLSKHLRTPYADLRTRATMPFDRNPVTVLKVEVTAVTYVDGSTSTTP